MKKRRPQWQDRASLSTVAGLAGVSEATVSRIVNGQMGRASAETVARVKEAIDTLDYRPNQIGMVLQGRRSRVVAMLSPGLSNPAVAILATALQASLRSAGYVTIFGSTHDRADLQDEYLCSMRSQAVAGYVIVDALPSAELSQAIERGDPIVFVCRQSPYGKAAFVGIDNRRIGADVADFFLSLGIRNLAIVAPQLGSSDMHERASGFSDRLQSSGIRPDDVRRVSIAKGTLFEGGYSAAEILADDQPWPQGVYCLCDPLAYGVFRYAQENGIRVPQDCTIVGVDDNVLGRWIAPWLTSIHIPYREFGDKILEQLQSAWAGEQPSSKVLPHQLRVGSSDFF